VHIDLYGLTRVRSLQGDDYSKMTWVTFCREKYDAFDRFKEFKAMVENEIDLKIKCLRFEKFGELISNEFNMFFEAHGIDRYFFVPRTS
jgi:hypothetical protein